MSPPLDHSDFRRGMAIDVALFNRRPPVPVREDARVLTIVNTAAAQGGCPGVADADVGAPVSVNVTTLDGGCRSIPDDDSGVSAVMYVAVVTLVLAPPVMAMPMFEFSEMSHFSISPRAPSKAKMPESAL